MAQQASDNPAARPLFVLGMHRSGTSALAGFCAQLGVGFGDRLMTPGRDNPKGFWERAAVADLHDERLGQYGLAWDELGPTDGLRIEAVGADERFRQRVAAMLRHELRGGRLWGLKDPRLSRFLPAWQPVLTEIGVAPVYLLALRHPSEVAASLARRDGFNADKSYLLWLRHLLEAERATRGATRVVVPYPNLLADWRAVASQVAELGGVDWPRSASQAAADVDAFLEPQLRHHDAASGETPSPRCSDLREWAELVYEQLSVGGSLDDAALEALDSVRDGLDTPDHAGAPIHVRVYRSATAAYEQRVNEQAGHIDALDSELGNARQEINDARAAIDERERRIADHELAISQQEATLREKDAELEQAQRESEGLRAALATKQEEVAALEQQTAQRDEAIEDARQHIAHLEAQLQDKEQALAALQRSLSYRITAPLRVVRALPRRCGPGVYRLGRAVFRRLPMPARWRDGMRERVLDRMRARAIAAGAAGTTDESGPGFNPGGDGSSSARTANSRDAHRAIERAALDAFLSSDGRLALPSPEDPTISIILVLYNQAELSFACLRSLAALREESFEVIIVDNASSDDTGALLERVTGARVIRNPDNRHFLKGCNQAVEEAAGEYILLLNNDAVPLPGTLTAARRVFEEESDVGAVGGRVVLLDGTLQEAGSTIWSDGGTAGYGRGCPPDAPAFMFRRDVDYCSGVFLLTPRRLWQALGGFDEAFAPAYYEETDYCMRLREQGWRIVYDPSASVLHMEFGTSGHANASEQMRRNRERFRDKHRDRLAADHAAPGDDGSRRALTPRRAAGRVLFIDDKLPHLDLGQGFPRSNQIVRTAVAQGYEVSIYPTDPEPEGWARARCDLPARAECLPGGDVRALAELLETRSGQYDVIYISRPHNMEMFQSLLSRRPAIADGARIIYDAEALFSLREIAKDEVGGKRVTETEKRRRIERETALADGADAVVTVTEAEGQLFDRNWGGRRFTLGHALAIDPTASGFDERDGLMFVGALAADDTPNADSLVWFIDEVWPRIRQSLGSKAVFRIIGANNAPAVAARLGDGVEALGRVEDLRAIYESARAVVVPTRYAAGIPYKAHEAAAHGVPMVTTTLIANQLGWNDDVDLLTADSDAPEVFADQSIRLHEDADLWARLRARALARIGSECSMAHFEAVVAEALASASEKATATGR